MKKETGGRVLVVDDHVGQRELLCLQLEDHGFEVTVAGSGLECLEKALADETLDVVLLDIEMPGMNGIETCKRLQEDEATSDLPVLFLTGWRDDDPVVIEALESGGNDFVNKTTSTRVIAARVQTQVEIRRAHRRIHELAMRDSLTGIFSRRFLFDALRRAVKTVARRGEDGLGCLILDADHFKRINDAVGHLQGDIALKRVANILTENTRETDVVARFGGEEFVVLLPQTGDRGTYELAEKLRAMVEKGAPCTVSVGVAWMAAGEADDTPIGEEDVDNLVQRLLARADRALYRAKETGRNKVCVWEDGVDYA